MFLGFLYIKTNFYYEKEDCCRVMRYLFVVELIKGSMDVQSELGATYLIFLLHYSSME